MSFRSAALRLQVQRLVTKNSNLSCRNASSLAKAPAGSGSLVPTGVLSTWYNTFGKSTSMYASWLVMMIVIGEFAFGKATDGLWTANNYGKTFTTVDWSKFDQFDESESGGDDEEEEEE